MKKLIAVFGPGNVEEGSELYREAYELGRSLAEANFVTLNGGYGGIMHAASHGARQGGGGVVGVTAEVYFARGRETNEFITKEIRVKSANDRLMELIDLADAYIAIGNSTGTLVEIMTAWDYMIKRFIPVKPLLLIGETWRAFHAYVLSDPHFAERELLRWTPDAGTAVRELVTIFGVQHNLPELNVVQR